MNLIEEVLRMRHGCGRSQRKIGSACGLSVGVVNGLLQRSDLAGLGRSLPAGLAADWLHERLYARAPGGAGLRADAHGVEPAQQPDAAPAMAEAPGGATGRVRVSQYYEPYREWKARRSPVMLQGHKAGRSCSWTTPGRRCRCGMRVSATERSPCPRRLEAPPRLPVPRPPRTARNSADAACPSIPSRCHHRGMGERLARSAWREPQVYRPASAHARSAIGGTEGCCILRGQERNHEFFTAITLPNPRSGDPCSDSTRSDSRGCLGVRTVAA